MMLMTLPSVGKMVAIKSGVTLPLGKRGVSNSYTIRGRTASITIVIARFRTLGPPPTINGFEEVCTSDISALLSGYYFSTVLEKVTVRKMVKKEIAKKRASGYL